MDGELRTAIEIDGEPAGWSSISIVQSPSRRRVLWTCERLNALQTMLTFVPRATYRILFGRARAFAIRFIRLHSSLNGR